jgi:hypothetical protein
MLIMQVFSDSGRMPDSGRKTRLRSYAQLWSEDMTPVICSTPVEYPDSRCTSWFRLTSRLWSYLLTPVAHHGSGRWACHMSYHLSYERLRMAELGDCNILQPRHLVKSRLGGMHDSFSIQNLNISRRPINIKPGLIWEKPEYSEGLGTLATHADQGLRMSGQASQGSILHDHGTKNWSHMGKIISSINRARSQSELSKASNALWTRCMMLTILNTKLGTTQWKIQTARVDWYLWLIRTMTSNVWV